MDEFTRLDKPVSYLKLFFGTFTLFFFKLFSSFFWAINLSLKLSKNLKKKEKNKKSFTNKEIKENIENTKYNATNFLRFSGIFLKKSVYLMKQYYQFIKNILVLIIK